MLHQIGLNILHQKIFNIRILPVHLKDIHADGAYVRFSDLSWREKLLRSYPDNENCDDSDDVMHAHDRISSESILRIDVKCCIAISSGASQEKCH
jgi:hypothetical protein